MTRNISTSTILLSALAIIGGTAVPTQAAAHDYYAIQQTATLTGTVTDEHGEPLTGASVTVAGTTTGTTVDADGRFTLPGVKRGARINISFIGYASQQTTWDGTSTLAIVLRENDNVLEEAVVTAMGIVRKSSSLTYSTQQLKSDELMKVQDPNIVNSMEGKVAGVTITPSAGGAGGATKILLRGNKSILGSNAPLIVVDGVPMTNGTRGQVGSGASLATSSVAEGSDPLSMINPDDIESMNVLKGANAAALYGSAAANGVVMITTKKGKEGRLDVNFTSNVTFDTPLLTPEIQNVYGANNSIYAADGSLKTSRRLLSSWGAKLSGDGTTSLQTIKKANDFRTTSKDIYGVSYDTPDTYDVHLRSTAVDDIARFLETGVTTNNSISLSGGTEKLRSYFSYANSYADGMMPTNSYTRNTFAFRQSYNLWHRLSIDVNANYVTTRTRNRFGGGTVGNPLYDLYTLPRDVDMDYYRDNFAIDGQWRTATTMGYYVKQNSGYVRKTGFAYLDGEMQNWAIQNPGKNNPYWITGRNSGIQREDRFYGSAQGRLDIYDGLAIQARVSIDQGKFNSESHKTATTWDPADLNEYGRYWLSDSRSSEIYTDYLLSYNKTFADAWSVSATAGWVGHVIKGQTTSTDATATIDLTGVESKEGYLSPIPRKFNIFDPQAGGVRTTSKSKSSNWDKAALFTAQFGWKDMIYVDGSYRRDWYRAFRQFAYQGTPDNYGYFGFGASAIISELCHLAEPVSYLKYRLSYSEVGNSIPNIFFGTLHVNQVTDAVTGNAYNDFYPIPEKTKSFETGFESQFFNNALNLDVTYYNSAMCNSYLTIPQGGRTQPVNTGKIRNQGVELTVGYDWHINHAWRWKTSVNFSYNKNRIVSTYVDENGNSKDLSMNVANGVQVRYLQDGQYGDMYANDCDRWGTDVYAYITSVLDPNSGTSEDKLCYTTDASHPGAQLIGRKGDIYVNTSGAPSFNSNTMSVNADGALEVTPGQSYSRYLGNMNSSCQLSWANTFNYRDFSLYVLVNGRIGGKVVSLTESYLDRTGVSQRTAHARLYAEAHDLGYKNGLPCPISEGGTPAMYINDGTTIVPIQTYYEGISVNDASNYVYDATNFRLRELALGYTFRNVFGDGKNISLSFIGRNLFFIYRQAPVDPDISLSTANGLGGFEMFNIPSARSFGLNLKLNF